MHDGDRFERNENDTTSKVIDGEAIIINLHDGTYYSMDGVGAEIWEMLAGKPTLGDVVAQLVARHDVDVQRAQADVGTLFEKLVAEQLVRRTGAAGTPAASTPASRGSAYQTPELACYRDMADLLALDPPTPGVLEDLMRSPGDEAEG